MATATTDANGAFSATFNVPASIGRNHIITTNDGTNLKQITFIMESTPPIPVALQPKMGVKAKSRAYFDWEDVNDPSLPITYTLQIASDADFTSIVLEKRKVLTTQNTPLSKRRVKAIDGASNESGWSGTGSFYVGFVMPS